MNRTVLLFVLVSNIWAVVSGQEIPKSITIPKINRDIVVDGRSEKNEWASIDSIAGFSCPWTSTGPDQTVFKSFCSEKYFNFYFNVVDKSVTTCDFKEEMSVASEDRVELFFSANPDLHQYYCIEIDPLGRYLDYSAQYYLKFSVLWDFRQVEISAKYTPVGYIVEGRIPMAELKKAGLKESFFLGIFRADYKSNNADDVVWYSWIKPDSPVPDFHIPTAFGICNLR